MSSTEYGHFDTETVDSLKACIASLRELASSLPSTVPLAPDALTERIDFLTDDDPVVPSAASIQMIIELANDELANKRSSAAMFMCLQKN